NITNVAVACSTGATTYTVGGTVSGMVGTGLTLAICFSARGEYGCHAPQQISANGEFTLDSAFPAVYPEGGSHSLVEIVDQPTSPPQRCVISNATIIIQNANDTSVTVGCAGYAFVTNAADNTLSSYTIDATTGALTAIGPAMSTGTSPYATAGFDSFDGEN